METARQQDVQDAVYGLAIQARPGTFYLMLRSFTLTLLSDGHNREELLEHYERTADRLEREDHEELQDDILEVMAELEGWSSPHARI